MQGSVGVCGLGVVFLRKNEDGESGPAFSKLVDGAGEAFAVAPFQWGVLRFRARFCEHEVDLVVCGFLAGGDDVVVAIVDHDYLGGVGVEEGDMVFEEVVKGDSGDTGVLVFLWEVGDVFENWVEFGGAEFEVAGS